MGKQVGFQCRRRCNSATAPPNEKKTGGKKNGPPGRNPAAGAPGGPPGGPRVARAETFIKSTRSPGGPPGAPRRTPSITLPPRVSRGETLAVSCTRIKKTPLLGEIPPRGSGWGPPRVKKLRHSAERTDPPTSPRGEAMSEPPAFVGGAVKETPAVPCTRIRKRVGEQV